MTDPTARDAYALLAKAAGDRINSLWLLMDGRGWLRGSGLGTMPETLEEAARAIGAAPLEEGWANH
jgi:hypothetical protein